MGLVEWLEPLERVEWVELVDSVEYLELARGVEGVVAWELLLLSSSLDEMMRPSLAGWIVEDEVDWP